MYLKSKLVVRFVVSKDAGKERGFPQWFCCGTPYTAVAPFERFLMVEARLETRN
jgi:hypothetical protein